MTYQPLDGNPEAGTSLPDRPTVVHLVDQRRDRCRCCAVHCSWPSCEHHFPLLVPCCVVVGSIVAVALALAVICAVLYALVLLVV